MVHVAQLVAAALALVGPQSGAGQPDTDAGAASGAVASPAPEAAWEPAAPFLVWAERLGPWLLAALTLTVVLRAVLRRHRYRAVDVLDDAAQERVHAAIRRAEARTVGEVVPVLLERADSHPAAPWMAALVTLLIGSTLLVGQLPWSQPFALMSCQLVLGACGYVLAVARPGVRRLFISEARAEHVCHEQALLEFHALRLERTAQATGVLVFVSLLEQRLIVLGDEGIDARVEPGAWDGVAELALAAIARGDLTGGLIAAVDACGEVLAQHVPWTGPGGDRNELPDRLVVRRA
jgi:putative membrane protein